MSTGEKFAQMLMAVAMFVAVMGVVLFLAGRVRSRRGEIVQTLAFVLPAVALLSVGLLYPAVRTFLESFKDANSRNWVGLDNYTWLFTDSSQLTILRNTAVWVIVTPFLATAIGLIYAVLIDKARIEAFAKALIFLPMAISLVGASLIWKFVYDYRPDQPGVAQIGLANQVLVWLGFDPYRFLLTEPWNTIFLIVIMIWIQTGFAMTVLSASIKAIPDDIIEAAKLDGVAGVRMFRYITLPSIRPALIVVLTTISIATLKVFDIVRTTTGGNFDTSVLAYEFYNQSFRSFDFGRGAALAVVLFVLVAPIVVYNVRQMRKAEAR
jgi:alpha-glucoside transport system permease protein